MSKLDRMNLMGIRSFGPEDADVQKIKFESPLTLIQGQNGCGKTTIIEAIKFAITGELPGGTARGQGFVYDPKLAKAFESVGKVKLRVINGRGELVTVMKIVRVLQKGPDKLEFKRMDSTISRGNVSDPMHASNRCADVDQEMCIELGVSKPIINQVLFCHQEDANWPLDESKKLKERFDEIFDAAKYNKCLDHISKKIKEKNEQHKLMKMEVVNLQDKKKFVENRKLTLHDKIEKFDGLTENVTEIETQLKPINERINELYTIEQNFSRLYTNIELKKKELEHLIVQQKEILETVKEFEGSDDELNEKVRQFKDDLKSFECDIEALKKKKQDCVDNEKDLSQKINQQQNILGSLQAESSHNIKNVDDRNRLILTIAKEYGIKNVNLEENDISTTIGQLKKSFDANKENVNTEQKYMEHEEDELQKEIDSAREENAHLSQNINSKKKQLQELEDEMRAIKHKLEELNTADDQLKLSENKLQRVEKEIKAMESSLDTDLLKQQIDKEKSKLKALVERSEIVEKEVRELQQYTVIQTEIDVKNENWFSKQKQLKRLMNTHDKSLMYIFKNNIPDANLKSSIESHILDKRKTIKNMTTAIDDKQKKVLKLENNLSSCREKLNEKENEFLENVEKIQQCCGDEPLDGVIEKTSNKLRQLHDNRGSLASSTYLYKNFIKKFQEDHPSCPLCKRNVAEKSAARQIIDDITKQIENIPNELKKLDAELNAQQKVHEKLLFLQPLNEKNKSLESDEIPSLKTQVRENKSQFDKYVEELSTLKTSLAEYQKNLDVSNSIVGDVCLIDQWQKEMATLKQEIAHLEKRMRSSSNADDQPKRSLDEAICERESLNVDIRTIQNNIESQQSKLSQHTERLQVRREQKNELLTQQLTIKKNLQDKDHLVTKSIEIEDKVLSFSVDLSELQEKTEPMKQKLNQCIKLKDELKSKHRKQMDHLRTKINNEMKKISQITSLQANIQEYESKNVINQKEMVLNEIIQFKESIEQFTKKKTQIDATIDDLKREVTNGQIYYRELQDNVQLREKQKKSGKLRKEIEIEEQNLGKNDIKQIRNEKSKLIDEYEMLTKQKHRKEGEKTQLDDDIKEIKKELAQPVHVKAADNYKRKQMEFLLLECTIIDLKEFIKAMDWSLMQYHKKRMVQVNSIIKELWRSIYKGNDIDYIEIKTDDIKTQGLEKRKLYSYRVVQVKNEVELEMRGRCSAGQRVLASLIIRIALAETFSNNCGILALDEPTTNLDRENINSLADALMELIQQKRQQKHFQLLIITHDQDFVDRLTQMESLDKYYEIKRNTLGKSVISVHNKY